MAVIRLFAAVREAAGTGQDEIEAPTLERLLFAAVGKYGPGFEHALAFCKVAVNGILIDEARYAEVPITASDEVALLPPVSGG